MRDGTKLTYEQKMILAKKGYDPQDYLLVRETPRMLVLLNRKTAEHVKVEK